MSTSRRSWLQVALLAGCTPPVRAQGDRGPSLAPIPLATSVDTPCGRRLTREKLDEAIALGTSFLLHNQLPEGNFAYLYDWRARRDIEGDSPVRQAGALWALACLHAHDPSPELRAALDRGLGYFEAHTDLRNDGAFVRYPGFATGRLGTVCLLALAYLDRRRVVKDTATDQRLRQLVTFIRRARRVGGGFHSGYTASGRPHGRRSSYFDGEALLVLVRAAEELEPSLGPLSLDEADRGWHRHVVEALHDDPDSDDTKGYYQWCSMALARLALEHPRMGDRLIQLAVWMVDVHHTLRRRRNTGYAYEGLVMAHAAAKRRGDAPMMRKLGCVIEAGLDKLMSWQVGFSGANAHIAAAGELDDMRALGGVQNHAHEAGLRIDVTQHQMHALLLARAHYLE